MVLNVFQLKKLYLFFINIYIFKNPFFLRKNPSPLGKMDSSPGNNVRCNLMHHVHGVLPVPYVPVPFMCGALVAQKMITTIKNALTIRNQKS